MSKVLKIAVMLTMALPVTVTHAGDIDALYTKTETIPAPDGRWDYASWDAAHQRLLVSHGKDVLIINPSRASASASVRAIGHIEGAHASLAIPGTDHILVTSAKDASVRILDATSGEQLTSINVAGDPDAAILSSDGHSAYVMGGDSGQVSVVDLETATETARYTLKPGLEAPILPRPNLIAANNEQGNEIELLDLTTGKPAGTIALPGCKGPTGLALASKTGLALSACRNGKAELVDINARKVLMVLEIGQGPDNVIWNEARHQFLVPCGKSGTLAVVRLQGRRAYLERMVTTEVSARTAALDPDSGRLYFPAAKFAPAPAGTWPAIIPGSFHILVLQSRS